MSEHQEQFIWESQAMRRIITIVDKVSSYDESVIFYGESGVGKSRLAEYLHSKSPRFREPFISFNVAALSDALIESELFGHEEGAFTGASRRHSGRFELAEGGTLFIDEVGELSLVAQAKLLRVINEKKFERVGGAETLSVRARLIFATNRNLSELIKSGEFREDLYYRLSVLPVTVPALRERPEDILPLVNGFIEGFVAKNGLKKPELTPCAIDALTQYSWSGNVRELKNFIYRCLILSDCHTIDKQEVNKFLEDVSPVDRLSEKELVTERDVLANHARKDRKSVV